MKSIDRVGAVASAFCAVHCVITGVAFGLLSYVGLGFMGTHIFDLVFLGVAVVIAIVATFHGIKRHHSYVPATVFTLGLLAVVFGHFVLHDQQQALSTALSVTGGVCFVAFHVLNMKLADKCGCDHCRTGQ